MCGYVFGATPQLVQLAITGIATKLSGGWRLLRLLLADVTCPQPLAGIMWHACTAPLQSELITSSSMINVRFSFGFTEIQRPSWVG